MHRFTCILSQTRTKREDPPSSARRDAHQSVPHRWVSQVETPRSPSGAFPVFRCNLRCDAKMSGDRLPDRCRARRSSTSTARCCAGASGEVFSEAMREAGLVSRTIPGERFLFSLFNTVGETLPSMALARQAVGFARGRSRAIGAGRGRQRRRPAGGDGAAVRARRVRAAPRRGPPAGAGDHDPVRPRQAVRRPARPRRRDRHPLRRGRATATRTTARSTARSSGRRASSRPFAAWAEEHDVDLRQSWSYSDSVYDTPLLAAVGHPVVVNPDPRMVFMAAARRWPTLNLDVSPGVRKVPLVGLELQRLAMAFSRTSLVPYAQIEIDGVEHIPADGTGDPRRQPPLLLRPGRDGDGRRQDPAARCASSARRRCSTCRSSGSIAKAMGGIRVDRGSGSDEPLRGRGRRRSPAARWWRSCRRARSREARRSSIPSSRAGGARPGSPNSPVRR